MNAMLTAIVSAMLGGAAVYALERVRWNREDRLRWSAPRRDAYSAFLVAIDRWDALDHAAAMRGEIEEWYDAPKEDLSEALIGVPVSTRLRPSARAAALATYDRLTDLELIGSSAVLAQAKTLWESMRALSAMRYSSPPRSCGGASGDLVAAGDTQRRHRDGFVAEARRDLAAK